MSKILKLETENIEVDDNFDLKTIMTKIHNGDIIVKVKDINGTEYIIPQTYFVDYIVKLVNK